MYIRLKKILSLIVLSCFLFTMIPTNTFAVPRSSDDPFDDVSATDWFYEPVKYAYDNGLMAGTGTRIFSPQMTTTRGMIVTILHRMENCPSVSAKAFDDVDQSQWYAAAANWAATKGVVNGYGNGKFGPNDPITREQMASIIMNYSNYKGYDTSARASLTKFTDHHSVSEYAEDVMKWAVGSGLLSGRRNNLLAPQGQTTRAEAATILMRYCEGIVGDPGSTNEDSEEKMLTITFDSAGGSTVEPQKVIKGKKAKQPKDPTYDNYSFMGWQIKGTSEQFDFSDPVNENLTLVAIWANKVSNDDYIYTLDNDAISYDESEKIYYVNNILIAFIEPGLDKSEKIEIAKSVNGSIVGDISGDSNILQIQVSENSISGLNSLARKLENNNNVRYARHDTPIRSDQLVAFSNENENQNQNQKNTDETWWYKAVHADTVWSAYKDYISPIRVGILDSTINPNNSDLWERIEFSEKYYETYNLANLTAGSDQHGTKVSRILLGNYDNRGVTGIAHHATGVFASYESDYRPLTSDWATASSIMYAFSTLVEKNAKVINCSFGYYFMDENHYKEDEEFKDITYGEYIESLTNTVVDSAELAAAQMCDLIKNRKNANDDFLVVQGAGNGMNNSGSGDVDAWYAGFWNAITDANASGICNNFGIEYSELDSHIITAGSITDKKTSNGYEMDTRCSYGNQIDVYAPGVNMFEKGDWGSSFAAPVVSGVAALVWSVDPSLSAAKVKNLLISQSTYKASGVFGGETFTGPVVDAEKAVEAAIGENEKTVYYFTGTVRDKMQLSPIENVVVTCSSKTTGETFSTTTDENGSFQLDITEDPASISEIRFEKTGYISETKKVLLQTTDHMSLGTIYLMKGGQLELPEIIVQVKGTVQDERTGAPISGVSVKLYDTKTSAVVASNITISNGTFILGIEQTGTYNLEIAKDGYSSIVRSNVYFPAGITNLGEILLTENNSSFAGGDGSRENPYQVATAAQLNAVRNDLDSHYIQIKDISLSGYDNWVPIGTDNGTVDDDDIGFSGSFDGNGFTISDMKIHQVITETTMEGKDYYTTALFGLADAASFSNISMSNVDISVSTSGSANPEKIAIGSIQGCDVSGVTSGINDYSTISNANIQSGKIVFKNENGYNKKVYVGGLSGEGYTIDSENHATITITGDLYFPGPMIYCGGITGVGLTAHDSKNYGDIKIAASRAVCCGGILGLYGFQDQGWWMNRCENYADIYVVSTEEADVGGIVGLNNGWYDLRECNNYGNVTYGLAA